MTLEEITFYSRDNIAVVSGRREIKKILGKGNINYYTSKLPKQIGRTYYTGFILGSDSRYILGLI